MILKKKVLFVIDSLGCGGAEKSLISLLPLLDYNKYEIDLMIISRGGSFEQYIPPSVNIIDYLPHNNTLCDKILYTVLHIVFSIKLRILKLFRIKKHGAEVLWSTIKCGIKSYPKKYDVAIAYQQGFPTYYVATRVYATKKIAWMNAYLPTVGYNERFNSYFYSIYNHIICVSEQLKILTDEKNPLLSEKTHVILDIINPDLIKHMVRNHNNNINCEGTTILVTTARLVKPKGHTLAIDAAYTLSANNISYKWFFIGEGPCRIELERLIKEYNLSKNIILLGEQSNPYPLMSKCDIYVQTSITEGFGLTIGEAKILQKPIVSTNFPVVHDQLTDGVNGLIVNMTGDDIANGIMRLIENPELKNTLIENLKHEINQTSITEPHKAMYLIEN